VRPTKEVEENQRCMENEKQDVCESEHLLSPIINNLLHSLNHLNCIP
jgi:hypothetical protein